MNKTIKCWLIANLETLNAISFFLFLIIVQINSHNENPPMGDSHNTSQISVFYWILIIIATISDILVSVKIAIYTYRNFDEIVSLRMLFHNSNVSLFQVQLKYSISRFSLTFMFVLFLYLSLVTLFQ